MKQDLIKFTLESHTGDDYTVVMFPDQTTDSASISVSGPDREDIAVRVTECWNAMKGVKDPMQLRMGYAGSITLLCDAHMHADEDEQEQIRNAVSDWCAATGWRMHRVIDRLEVFPPGS